MKIPWPDHYKLPCKVLSIFAAVVICLTWMVGFVVGVWVYLTGGK